MGYKYRTLKQASVHVVHDYDVHDTRIPFVLRFSRGRGCNALMTPHQSYSSSVGRARMQDQHFSCGLLANACRL